MYIALTRRGVIVLAALAAASAAGFAVWALIDTDSKRIGRTIDAIEHAVEKGDSAGLRALMDPACRISGVEAEKFMPWYDAMRPAMRIKDVSQYDRTIKLDAPDHATVTVLTFIVAEALPGEQRVDWRLEFRRHGKEEWKLLSARAFMPPPVGLEIPLRPTYDLLH